MMHAARHERRSSACTEQGAPVVAAGLADVPEAAGDVVMGEVPPAAGDMDVPGDMLIGDPDLAGDADTPVGADAVAVVAGALAAPACAAAPQAEVTMAGTHHAQHVRCHINSSVDVTLVYWDFRNTELSWRAGGWHTHQRELWPLRQEPLHQGPSLRVRLCQSGTGGSACTGQEAIRSCCWLTACRLGAVRPAARRRREDDFGCRSAHEDAQGQLLQYKGAAQPLHDMCECDLPCRWLQHKWVLLYGGRPLRTDFSIRGTQEYQECTLRLGTS